MDIDFPNFVKKVRQEKKLTQEDVAIKGGLKRSYISRLEDGHFANPSAMILIRLANGLGVSHETVFHEAGYVAKIKSTTLPSFDVYLRAKFPGLSEEAIGQIEFYKNFLQESKKRKK